MTIPMNNTLSNPSRERAQRLFNKNAELEIKRRKAAQAKIPSDPTAWQRIRENYESILLEDHAFSEKHDIEYALWQLHYKRIEELRAHFASAQNANNPDRITKIRSQFKTFLSEATGFYHDLMVKIRAKYGLSLGYMLDDSEKGGDKSIDVKKGLLSCHRSFIYLGDLARYKGLYGEGDSKARDFDAALSYYKQAATLWPSSGNPHHQLAILASYSGDELLAVYRYFRSLAVDTPFTTARDNLIIAFEKNRQSYCHLLEDLKPAPAKKLPAHMNWKGRNRGEIRASLKDRKTEPNSPVEKEPTVLETLKAFSIRFVRLNGILFTRTSLETFEEVFSVARTDFLQLLSSGQDEVFSFGSDYNVCELFITRFIAVMIFIVYNANKETENQSYTEILQRSVVLQNAFTAVFDFMALIVDRCLQLNHPSGSFLLPGIMIFVEWLACCEGVVVTNEVDEKQAASRSLFWNNFVSFLNKMMLSSGCDESEDETCIFNVSRYDECETENRLALPEDIELRGFLPLVPAHLILDYSRAYRLESDGSKEKKARVQRIIAAGKALATNIRVRQEKIYFDSKSNRFFYGMEPHNVNDVQNINMTGQEINEEGEGEDDDEDEVIVFKPSMPERHADDFSSKPMSSEGIMVSGINPLMSHGDFPLESPASPINGNAQNLQFAQPNASRWMMGGEEFIENGFSNLSLSGNGVSTRPERDINSGILKSGSFQDPSTMIPSKFDSVMTSVSNFDSVSSKTKFHKSPVSRPVRHIGPPPGFNTAAPKRAFENPVLDDYSWLDGYQLPCTAYSDGFSNLPQPNKLLNTNKTSSGMECFPFPGKQVSTVSGGIGIGNGWLDYQIPEQSSLYQEAVKKGNEQFIAVPQQYQGQSLWEGRFFV